MSCSAPDGNRITEMFHFIYAPPKKYTIEGKNVTSGEWYVLSPASCNRQRSQRVQRNIGTQQNPHNLYRCLVRIERYPNIQAVCTLQCLVPPRSLTSAVELRLQRRRVSTLRRFGCARGDWECASELLLRCKANAGGEKRTWVEKRNWKKLQQWNRNRMDQN